MRRGLRVVGRLDGVHPPPPGEPLSGSGRAGFAAALTALTLGLGRFGRTAHWPALSTTSSSTARASGRRPSAHGRVPARRDGGPRLVRVRRLHAGRRRGLRAAGRGPGVAGVPEESRALRRAGAARGRWSSPRRSAASRQRSFDDGARLELQRGRSTVVVFADSRARVADRARRSRGRRLRAAGRGATRAGPGALTEEAV